MTEEAEENFKLEQTFRCGMLLGYKETFLALLLWYFEMWRNLNSLRRRCCLQYKAEENTNIFFNFILFFQHFNK